MLGRYKESAAARGDGGDDPGRALGLRVADAEAAAADAADARQLATSAAAVCARLLERGPARTCTLTDLWCEGARAATRADAATPPRRVGSAATAPTRIRRDDAASDPTRRRRGAGAYNRARGAAGLCSPEDLAGAASRYLDVASPKRLKDAPVVLRVFRSGVRVLCLSDEDVVERVSSAVPPAGADALAVARALHVPAALGLEHLLDAEDAGAVCRDKGPAGLAFFPNEFLSRVAVTT